MLIAVLLNKRIQLLNHTIKLEAGKYMTTELGGQA